MSRTPVILSLVLASFFAVATRATDPTLPDDDGYLSKPDRDEVDRTRDENRQYYSATSLTAHGPNGTYTTPGIPQAMGDQGGLGYLKCQRQCVNATALDCMQQCLTTYFQPMANGCTSTSGNCNSAAFTTAPNGPLVPSKTQDSSPKNPPATIDNGSATTDSAGVDAVRQDAKLSDQDRKDIAARLDAMLK